MKELVKGNQGFTLLESLIVLIITVLLVSFPVLSVERAQEEIKVNLFIEELASGIRLIQNHAIFNGEATVMEIQPDARQAVFYVMGKHDSHPLNYTLSLPEGIEFNRGLLRYRFSAKSGNIGKYERLKLFTSRGDYEFVFQMGSGRFYVRKVE